jgi:hypothetical protein
MHPIRRSAGIFQRKTKRKFRRTKKNTGQKAHENGIKRNKISNCKFRFTPEGEMRNDDGAEFICCEGSFRGSGCWRGANTLHVVFQGDQ